MASANVVILVGNVTRDIELRYTASQMAVCNLGIAVNERRKGQDGEWRDEPVFVDATAFGKTAELCNEYLKKGSQVYIEGRLKLEKWEKDGQRHQKLSVVAEKVQFLGVKADSSQAHNYSAKPQPTQQAPQAVSQTVEEDVPF